MNDQRLIDADALSERLKDLDEWCIDCRKPGIEQARCMVHEAPTVEPKRGEWITKTRHEHWPSGKPYEADYCSVCKKRGSLEFDFCPNCGADMRGTT